MLCRSWGFWFTWIRLVGVSARPVMLVNMSYVILASSKTLVQSDVVWIDHVDSTWIILKLDFDFNVVGCTFL